jgi:hypothetical protein
MAPLSSPALTESALAHVLGAPPVPEACGEDVETIAAVDALLGQSWKDHRLEAARDASDLEYLRRATLDIIGRVPHVAEIERFEKDDKPNRRGRLIDGLLDSDEYQRYWSELWTDWLLLPLTPPDPQVVETSGAEVFLKPAPVLPDAPRRALRAWLEARFSERERGFDTTVRELLAATGASDERGAVNFLLVHMGEKFAASDVVSRGHYDMVPATKQTLRLFLGYRMEGLPGHKISADGAWTAEQFWGVNAFLRQSNRELREATPVLTDHVRANESAIVDFRTPGEAAARTKARFLDGEPMPVPPKGSRREDLAQRVINHTNFAEAYVSRVWAQFFGRGFHERPDVDDFGKHHALRHAALLGRLARDFKNVKYEPRRLIRWICAGRAYHLSVIPAEPTRREEGDRSFSHMALKPMNAYQLYESLCTVLRRPREKNDERVWERVRVAVRRYWVANEATGKQETPGISEINPALFLMDDRDVNDLIRARAEDLHGDETSPQEFCDRLFLPTFARRARKDEVLQIRDQIKPVLIKEKDPVTRTEDLLWALLQSGEFILNH